MPAIAITGGLGYLGGRIAQGLASDVEIRLLTRDDTRPLPAWASRYAVTATDLLDPQSLEAAFAGADVAIHLAAMNAGACAKDSKGAFHVNVDGTANVITAAAAAGVRRVIYMSTAHVYGAPLAGYLDEGHPTTNSHPYASTHRAAEDIVLAAPGNVVLRLSNAVGAPMDRGADCWMLIANDLCRQAVEEGTLTLRGTGFDQRDFIPMAEVVRAVSHVACLTPPALGDGLFNLAAGTSMTTRALASLIAERAGIVLGKHPTIGTAPDDGHRPADVTIPTDRLAATGLVIDADLTAEIDATLIFCKEAFGRA